MRPFEPDDVKLDRLAKLKFATDKTGTTRYFSSDVLARLEELINNGCVWVVQGDLYFRSSATRNDIQALLNEASSTSVSYEDTIQFVGEYLGVLPTTKYFD